MSGERSTILIVSVYFSYFLQLWPFHGLSYQDKTTFINQSVNSLLLRSSVFNSENSVMNRVLVYTSFVSVLTSVVLLATFKTLFHLVFSELHPIHYKPLEV